MRVLAFDPSINTTGLGVVERRGDRLVEGALIRTGDGDLETRATELRRDALENLHHFSPDLVVVELPAATGRHTAGQGFGARSALYLPNYGIAVGMVLSAALEYLSRNQARPAGLSPTASRLITRAADAWTKGLPGTKNDEHKTARVRLVEQLYVLNPGALGAETVAGNVADAILLARHVAGAMHSDASIKELQPCTKEATPATTPTRRRAAKGAGARSGRASA